jgi:hypothetical protein
MPAAAFETTPGELACVTATIGPNSVLDITCDERYESRTAALTDE